MTRSQRYFLAIAILFLAWFFHISLCDWHWKARISTGTLLNGQWQQYPIWTYSEIDNSKGGYVTTGLTAGEWLDPHVALICGVFLPLILVVTDVWWMLGWRRQSRLASGCCLACGYDLKGTAATKCPECGTPRSA